MKTNQLLIAAALGVGAWYYFSKIRPHQLIAHSQQLTAGGSTLNSTESMTPANPLFESTSLANAAIAGLDDGTQFLTARALLPMNTLSKLDNPYVIGMTL